MAIETPDDRDGRASAESSFPICTSCGNPVTIVTVTEPSEAIASPCGCRVTPSSLEQD